MAQCGHGSPSQIARTRLDEWHNVGGRHNDDATVGSIDPSAFGFAKAAYTVGEALHMLSIGRTSLYAVVERGDLKHVKFGKKTLFYATDLVSFLINLKRLSEADLHRADKASGGSKRLEQS
jgi:excisionase family DNA binding protein